MTLAEVGTGLKIVEFLAKTFQTDKREDIVKVLQFIRFDDDGVLSIINKIIEGKHISTQEWATALPEFNDQEWNVMVACNQITHQALEGSVKVSRLDRNELEKIRNGKLSVRKAVQDYLNHARNQKRFDIEGLKELRSDILKLNAIIDKAEASMIGRS